MSTTRSRFVIVAMAALGLTGWMAPQPRGPEDPDGPAGETAPRTPEFVLLTDGRLVKGIIAEEDNQIVVTQPIGAMRFPKKRVEQVFPSIRKVYDYKLAQLPENDNDERLKLARWCLAQQLRPQARQQLEAILDHSPKHPQAKAMLVSLDQSRERRQLPAQDPEVRQTAGVPERGPIDDRPASLDAAVISGARRGMGLSDMPVVFDLPPAQAVRRAEEFARFVHPVLQVHCARCHNDRYDGNFQLIEFKTKADRTRNALKANLDACLRLVDRQNPVRSELLASSLRPHGRGPAKRPIFQGSNNPSYQILASWVNKLQATSGGEGNVRARRPTPGEETGEAFASARGRVQGDRGSATAEPMRFVTGPVETKVLPPARYEAGKGLVPDTSNDPDEFPIPFATSGKKPTVKSAPGAKPVAGPAPDSSPAQPVRAADPSVLPAANRPATTPPGAEAVAKASAGAAEPEAAPTADATDADKKKPRKPLKLDPSLLQRALQLKNQAR